ncbi:hypothetical protein CCP4SC76_1750002 [Gammaproteobacteria bacterium]
MKTPLLLSLLAISALILSNPDDPGKTALAKSPGRFLINPDGTVLDTKTRLIWMHCAVGQSWDGQICAGDTLKMPWNEAKQLIGEPAGHGDWRLPTLDELRTLVRQKNPGMPTIDPTAFPGTPSLGFWSDTPDKGDAFYALGIDFNYGHIHSFYRSYDYAVRLVRGG